MNLLTAGLAAVGMLFLQGCGGGVPSSLECPGGCTLKVSCESDKYEYTKDKGDCKGEESSLKTEASCDKSDATWDESDDDGKECINSFYCCKIAGGEACQKECKTSTQQVQAV